MSTRSSDKFVFSTEANPVLLLFPLLPVIPSESEESLRTPYRPMKTYWIYIMSNRARTVLYIGVTNNLERRVAEHKLLNISGFTERYRCTHLVYFEESTSIGAAIEREKELKAWRRVKKERLIRSANPLLRDLSVPSR